MKKLFLTLIVISSTIFIKLNGQEVGLGLVFDDAKYEASIKKAVLTRSLYSEIPSTYSLKKFAPEPKSQGQYGTCVGWSTCYAGMTILESISKNRTDITTTTNNTFSPGFVYKQIKSESDLYCKMGTYIDEALEILKTKGTVKYSSMTEVNCPTYLSPSQFTDASNYKIKDYAKLFDIFESSDFKISAVKKSISQNNPVIIGMNTPESFYTALGAWIPTESSSNSYGGHAMCVIGYDDSQYGGAFEIMNSWGTQWGNSGFIWIKYEDFANFVKYAYEMIEFKTKIVEEERYTFGGSIRYVKNDATESKATYNNGLYTINESYKSGTLFRMYISNTQSTYVYAFGFDATGKTFTIFPHSEGISPLLNYSSNSIAIPDEDHYIQSDNTIGKDYMCVIYSKFPLDIESIKKSVEGMTGNLNERISIILKDKIVENSNLSLSVDDISFNVTNSTRSIVPIIIETAHVN
jgi:C1A family cysteine protease